MGEGFSRFYCCVNQDICFRGEAHESCADQEGEHNQIVSLYDLIFFLGHYDMGDSN